MPGLSGALGPSNCGIKDDMIETIRRQVIVFGSLEQTTIHRAEPGQLAVPAVPLAAGGFARALDHRARVRYISTHASGWWLRCAEASNEHQAVCFDVGIASGQVFRHRSQPDRIGDTTRVKLHSSDNAQAMTLHSSTLRPMLCNNCCLA